MTAKGSGGTNCYCFVNFFPFEIVIKGGGFEGITFPLSIIRILSTLYVINGAVLEFEDRYISAYNTYILNSKLCVKVQTNL